VGAAQLSINDVAQGFTYFLAMLFALTFHESAHAFTSHLDIFVGCFTALILGWAGVLAWNAGAGSALSGSNAFFTVVDFIGGVTLFHAIIGLFVISLCWRLVRILLFR
jgi:hypothetical protein